MSVKSRLHASVLVGVASLLCACAELPDRLDNLADAGRRFAIVHPLMTRTAVFAARAALRKPQHLRFVCSPSCRIEAGSGTEHASRRPVFINLNQ
ncbi:MAG TPA: hypothetical protein VFK87_05020 [Steroidobacteraceae bacterium]|nr:hypothetical protein [Steroidobacteraceae bacterium]